MDYLCNSISLVAYRTNYLLYTGRLYSHIAGCCGHYPADKFILRTTDGVAYFEASVDEPVPTIFFPGAST